MSAYAQITDNIKGFYQDTLDAFGNLIDQVSGPTSAHSTFDHIESLIKTEGMDGSK